MRFGLCPWAPCCCGGPLGFGPYPWPPYCCGGPPFGLGPCPWTPCNCGGRMGLGFPCGGRLGLGLCPWTPCCCGGPFGIGLCPCTICPAFLSCCWGDPLGLGLSEGGVCLASTNKIDNIISLLWCHRFKLDPSPFFCLEVIFNDIADVEIASYLLTWTMPENRRKYQVFLTSLIPVIEFH